MKNKVLVRLFLALSTVFISNISQAFYTEVGLSYGHDKKNFDSNNYTESESITGELSFYFWEKIALELSYTDATSLIKQKASTTDPSRTTQQKTKVLGSDVILMFADRKAFFQPFIKAGIAQIDRRQEIKIEGFDTQSLEPEVANVPSYGAGLKMLITDAMSLKLSYNIWRTPIGGGTYTDDNSTRAGISWIF